MMFKGDKVVFIGLIVMIISLIVVLIGMIIRVDNERKFTMNIIKEERNEEELYKLHNGIEIKMKDACQLRITPQDIDRNMVGAKLHAYRTCRNWQFAHTIKRILTNEIDVTDREVQ